MRFYIKIIINGGYQILYNSIKKYITQIYSYTCLTLGKSSLRGFYFFSGCKGRCKDNSYTSCGLLFEKIPHCDRILLPVIVSARK
jgi:hypothetical protein